MKYIIIPLLFFLLCAVSTPFALLYMLIKFVLYFIWNFKAPDMTYETSIHSEDGGLVYVKSKTIFHFIWGIK